MFTGLAIAAGMIWARPVWGQFWVWEPRLITTALLFFIYLGYLALRRAIPDPVLRARRAALTGIVAAFQVVVVYFSVDWWRSLHQQSSRNSIDAPLRVTLWLAVLAFTIAYAALMRRRIRLAEAETAIEEHESAPMLASRDVTAPKIAEVSQGV